MFTAQSLDTECILSSSSAFLMCWQKFCPPSLKLTHFILSAFLIKLWWLDSLCLFKLAGIRIKYSCNTSHLNTSQSLMRVQTGQKSYLLSIIVDHIQSATKPLSFFSNKFSHRESSRTEYSCIQKEK